MHGFESKSIYFAIMPYNSEETHLKGGMGDVGAN